MTLVQRPSLSLGIEEEFMILDPVTRELKSHVQEIIEDGKLVLKEFIKSELHQSVVEVGTGVCKDIAEARKDVFEKRRELAKLALSQGMRIGASSTHPFSHWKDQLITPDVHYKNIIDSMQMVARANLIFGLHVHVGIENKQTAIEIMNEARYFLPHLLALSSNSPFWQGRRTGLKSYRTKVFDKFPRTNIPDYFASYSEFERFVEMLIQTNCIDSSKKIWWDIRPHPKFSTLEFRICDIPLRADETLALAAVIQALVAKLYKLRSQNLGFRLYRRDLIMENKWRAARYGIEGKMIDFGRAIELDAESMIHELLEFVDDVVDELGSRDEVAYLHRFLESGTGADRQLAIYDQTNDLKKVVDYIILETHKGLGIELPPIPRTEPETA
ncbi:MAG: carboxylate-amine ligase [Ectothiorhodospiraceae bacterium]|nr:carboxylate-amine ligase [Ectothiorhodospiraceae bacterium]